MAFLAGAEIPAAAALATRCEQLPQNCLIRHNRGLQQTFVSFVALCKRFVLLVRTFAFLREIFILSLNLIVAFAT